MNKIFSLKKIISIYFTKLTKIQLKMIVFLQKLYDFTFAINFFSI